MEVNNGDPGLEWRISGLQSIRVRLKWQLETTSLVRLYPAIRMSQWLQPRGRFWAFQKRKKHKMETWWPYCIHSASDYCNHPSATKSNIVVRNFIAENSWHDKTNCMARRACNCQGRLQRLASQQVSERANLKCVNRQWEKNSARVQSVTSDARGVHAAAIAVGVTSGTDDLEGGAFVVPSNVLCSSGPWVDVRCALVVIHTKYIGVCYN